jgi:twitching motility protein PilI
MSDQQVFRDFAETLAERLQHGGALLEMLSGSDDLPGGRHWLVDPAQAGEIVPVPPLTPVPLTQPWFAGVANIRGTLFTVVDFAAWRGGEPTPRTAKARLLLIAASDGRHDALLVEQVPGLHSLDGLQITEASDGQEKTAFVATGAANAWRKVVLTSTHDNARWTCLNVPLLLVTPAYLEIVTNDAPEVLR